MRSQRRSHARQSSAERSSFLVGTELGAWSSDIGDDRLAELVSAARIDKTGSSPAAVVELLVRSVQAEPVDSGLPWGRIGAVLVAAAAGALLGYDRLIKRRAPPRRATLSS